MKNLSMLSKMIELTHTSVFSQKMNNDHSWQTSRETWPGVSAVQALQLPDIFLLQRHGEQ